jgi:hypothetical protein
VVGVVWDVVGCLGVSASVGDISDCDGDGDVAVEDSTTVSDDVQLTGAKSS